MIGWAGLGCATLSEVKLGWVRLERLCCVGSDYVWLVLTG